MHQRRADCPRLRPQPNYWPFFSIDAQWGGNVDAYGNTSGTCCVGMPRVYRPGL
ncbi:DUF3304 domain-containing protein [Cupriavidus sp. 2MCAB6]|uniref:DUF3304 domain-containing protein n=1 Tax=Cupriavidus sp. 2MCAB6 TaxID=3232981 RepID=UPI003F93EFA1